MNESPSRLRDPKDGMPLRKVGDKLVSLSGMIYPIIDGIPRFVPSEIYAADFGKQWRMFPKTQLDSFTGLSITADRLKRCLGESFDVVRGKTVLEAGSGAGRFTEILLAKGAVLDSFDISSAVEANAQNNNGHDFNLVQADIRSIPFERDHYDVVLCLGVLQHTPDTEESIASLWSMVKPGGMLVIDHYDWNRWRLPPPIGSADIFHRRNVLRMQPEKRWEAVRKSVDFWFPIYWRHRDNPIARKILARIGGINFYYPNLPLGSREAHYQWSLLDTHDARTDYYHRYRTVGSIDRTLRKLGGIDIVVWKGGNGVEARCRKPLGAAKA